MTQPTDRLWGARFASGPAAALAALSRSPQRYFQMAPYDLAGSRAHTRELQRAGLLDSDETTRMLAAIDTLDADFRAGRVQPIVYVCVRLWAASCCAAVGGRLLRGRVQPGCYVCVRPWAAGCCGAASVRTRCGF